MHSSWMSLALSKESVKPRCFGEVCFHFCPLVMAILSCSQVKSAIQTLFHVFYASLKLAHWSDPDWLTCTPGPPLEHLTSCLPSGCYWWASHQWHFHPQVVAYWKSDACLSWWEPEGGQLSPKCWARQRDTSTQSKPPPQPSARGGSFGLLCQTSDVPKGLTFSILCGSEVSALTLVTIISLFVHSKCTRYARKRWEVWAA